MDPDGAGSTMELPPPELHENLLQEIELSPKQRQAALAYRNHLLSRMGATLRQRRDISLQLLRTLGAQQPSAEKQVSLLLPVKCALRRTLSIWQPCLCSVWSGVLLRRLLSVIALFFAPWKLPVTKAYSDHDHLQAPFPSLDTCAQLQIMCPPPREGVCGEQVLQALSSVSASVSSA